MAVYQINMQFTMKIQYGLNIHVTLVHYKICIRKQKHYWFIKSTVENCNLLFTVLQVL